MAAQRVSVVSLECRCVARRIQFEYAKRGRGKFWIGKKKVADSKISGYVWKKPKWNFILFLRVVLRLKKNKKKKKNSCKCKLRSALYFLAWCTAIFSSATKFAFGSVVSEFLFLICFNENSCVMCNLRADVIESALYGVVVTRCLCQKNSWSLARTSLVWCFWRKQPVNITPYTALYIAFYDVNYIYYIMACFWGGRARWTK